MREALALELAPLVESPRSRGFGAGHDLEGRRIALRLLRYLLAHLGEEGLRIAVHLRLHVADAAAGPAFLEQFGQEKQSGFQQIPFHISSTSPSCFAFSA